MKTATTWTETKTIKVGNCTVVIHRPELTPAQRQERERVTMTALAKYGRAAEAAGNERINNELQNYA